MNNVHEEQRGAAANGTGVHLCPGQELPEPRDWYLTLHWRGSWTFLAPNKCSGESLGSGGHRSLKSGLQATAGGKCHLALVFVAGSSFPHPMTDLKHGQDSLPSLAHPSTSH